MKRFRLGTDVDGNYFYHEVRIYDSLEEARLAYHRSFTLSGREPKGSPVGQDGDEWLALSCPRVDVGVRSDGTEYRVNRRIGYLIFAAEYLSPLVVSHELIHAAMSHYRETEDVTSERDRADFGDGCSEAEECFAHIYGELFRKMNLKLHDLGYWR